MKKMLFALLLAAGCGTEIDTIDTATSELVSSDACGVTLGTAPFYPMTSSWCTKAGKTTWRCTEFNTTTHTCQSTHGTVKIAGSTWYAREASAPADGYGWFVPGRLGITDDTDHGEDGLENTMVMPKGTAITTFSTLYNPGWSHAVIGTVPNAIRTFGLNEFVVVGGSTMTSFCAYRQPNFIDQIGPDCWRAPPGQIVYGSLSSYGWPVVQSLQVF